MSSGGESLTELRDRLAEVQDPAVDEHPFGMDMAGAWTPFTPAECRVIASAMAMIPAIVELTGAAWDGDDEEDIEALRVKAITGGWR